ncbi:hypothetical protein ES692_00185 [Psychroserpens burtonensis]|uniref:DUF4258 domain-containing protein n=1 Tax=Psychroserpens burtonensis TaxID=49278 RepID=A0A5C7BEB5_9FLAO|nr:hypothetical protein [Psychroserpens burtonensis]TXE20250.1 hypothetical protein ES692_00185 [Psychroserpens burtonensis]
MKLLHRIGYYLGGFSIGLILLAFFLGGKKTSCDYSPNARTIKNISIKERFYSEDTQRVMQNYSLDTLAVSELIKTSSVNFSESDTKGDSCKTYLLENEIDDKKVELWIKNCDSSATIQSIKIN